MRKRDARAAALLVAAALTAGCEVVATREPVVPPAAAVFDSTLVGTWSPAGDGETRAVVTRDGDEYDVEYVEGDRTVRFDARLGVLGTRPVLDLVPAADPGPGSEGEVDAGPEVANRLPLLLRWEGEALRFAILEPDSVRGMLSDGRLDLPYVVEERHGGREIVLTAETDRLRAELAGYVDGPGVLHWSAELMRRSPAAEGSPERD
ncbi:MAG: hypothetical protein ACOC9N_01675 [Gemmatimonadota bacterium]